jgi:hypothetical protein
MIFLPILVGAGLLLGATQVFRIPGVDLPEGTLPGPGEIITPAVKAAAPWVIGGLIAYKVIEKRI